MNPRKFPTLPAIGALALIYLVAGKLSLHLAFLHKSASPVWPPAGIALAALLVLGFRVWPAIFVGAFLVNLTTVGNVLSSLGIASGNTLEALCGAWLVNQFAGGMQVFEFLGVEIHHGLEFHGVSFRVACCARRWRRRGKVWLGAESLVSGMPEGEYVIGDFTHEDGGRYVMIVNKSLSKSICCTPRFKGKPKLLSYVSPISGKTEAFPVPYYWLAPGQGVLLRVEMN